MLCALSTHAEVQAVGTYPGILSYTKAGSFGLPVANVAMKCIRNGVVVESVPFLKTRNAPCLVASNVRVARRSGIPTPRAILVLCSCVSTIMTPLCRLGP